MNIAYSCNDFYISQTGISIISLFENNRFSSEINIYLISNNISSENINIISSICDSYKRNLIVIPFKEIAFDLNISNTGRHSETVYSKIFFSRIEGLNKCLYIDSDTIISGSLKSLWDLDIDNVYLAAVETISKKNSKILDLKPNSVFFNDGVTLMNVDYCRENNLIQKSLSLIEKYNGNPPVLSEGILNVVCESKIIIIGLRYNLMASMYQLAIENPEYLSKLTTYTTLDIIDSCNKPIIIHFLSAYYSRPWSKQCTHPLKGQYLMYKKISPWKDLELIDEDTSLKLRLMKGFGIVFGFDTLFRISRIWRII